MGVMGVRVWRHELPRTGLRRAALRYAAHGWPVVPGTFADPTRSRHACGRVACPVRGAHPAVADWTSAATVDAQCIAQWWAHGPYAIVLPTGAAFDVVEMHADLGAAAAERLVDRSGRPAAPIAVAPNGRWHVLVRPGGTWHPELSGEVVLHGAGSWVLAPPSPLPSGRVRWLVPPEAVGWEPADAALVQDTLVMFTRRRNR